MKIFCITSKEFDNTSALGTVKGENFNLNYQIKTRSYLQGAKEKHIISYLKFLRDDLRRGSIIVHTHY